MDPIRVLLADDHAVLRAGLRALLSSQPDIEVVGEAATGRPANFVDGLNIYTRLGAPIVWQLGAWVPGRRTTLELLPAIWFFGTNDDYVGQTLKTDPKFQLDAHLTRDFTEHFWGSLDTVYYYGGKATINGVAGEKINTLGLGLTLERTLAEIGGSVHAHPTLSEAVLEVAQGALGQAIHMPPQERR